MHSPGHASRRWTRLACTAAQSARCNRYAWWHGRPTHLDQLPEVEQPILGAADHVFVPRGQRRLASILGVSVAAIGIQLIARRLVQQADDTAQDGYQHAVAVVTEGCTCGRACIAPGAVSCGGRTGAGRAPASVRTTDSVRGQLPTAHIVQPHGAIDRAARRKASVSAAGRCDVAAAGAVPCEGHRRRRREHPRPQPTASSGAARDGAAAPAAAGPRQHFAMDARDGRDAVACLGQRLDRLARVRSAGPHEWRARTGHVAPSACRPHRVPQVPDANRGVLRAGKKDSAVGAEADAVDALRARQPQTTAGQEPVERAAAGQPARRARTHAEVSAKAPHDAAAGNVDNGGRLVVTAGRDRRIVRRPAGNGCRSRCRPRCTGAGCNDARQRTPRRRGRFARRRRRS